MAVPDVNEGKTSGGSAVVGVPIAGAGGAGKKDIKISLYALQK
jgi:hypothetical protein